MNQNNYGERLSACAHNSLGPKNKYMATKEVLYVDNKKPAMPIEKKATIIASRFSSPKQLEMNYASSVVKNSHPRDNKQAVATKENVVAALEGSNVLPTIDVQQKDVTLCAAISSSPGREAGHPSSDIESEPQVDDSNDASDGLSMMAHEVHSDGTNVAVKGQRSSIFQTTCKIQNKVYKLIIDGGSFTNAISSDLVHALSLSTRRLPMPRYIQWMNQSGTLIITHRVRVKFSIGTYIDTVDCDVAPMSACHLLLGRPWQFDLDATHGGRSNNYSFVHKGVHYVLKPMLESSIKPVVFATVKVKKKDPEIIPKSRTALLQEGENDVTVTSQIFACESSSKDSIPKIASASAYDHVSNNVTLIGREHMLLATKSDLTVSFNEMLEGKTLLYHDVSHSADVKGNGGQNMLVATQCKSKDNDADDEQMKEDARIEPKPRTTLFKGREDDEPMDPQNIHANKSSINLNIAANNSLKSSGLKFGAVIFNEKYITNMEKFTTSGLSSNIIFGGVTFKKEYDKKPRKYIYVGSMKVDIT
jgi:hypothetical protein